MSSLAVDWVGGNLYWADEALMSLSVASLHDNSVINSSLKHDNSVIKTVIRNLEYPPRSLALDPTRGFIFWSEFGGSSDDEMVQNTGSIR